MTAWLHRHWPLLLNVLLVVAIGRYAAVKAWAAWIGPGFTYVEIAFVLHNVVLLTMILIRRQHIGIDRNPLHQAIAMGAFFSGIAFIPAPCPATKAASQILITATLLLSAATLINLGRSFGILIAVRRIKTHGLYGIVRHPMYLTDILWRVAYFVGNPHWLNAVLLVGSSACYVWRALLEERFLSRYDDYRAYRQRVRYRFIPGLF